MPQTLTDFLNAIFMVLGVVLLCIILIPWVLLVIAPLVGLNFAGRPSE